MNISRRSVLVLTAVLLGAILASLFTWERILERGMADKTLSAEITAERGLPTYPNPTMDSNYKPDATKASELQWYRENSFINVSNYKRYNVGPEMKHVQDQLPELPRTGKRILVVGDSFVHGTGLEDMRTRWGDQLQQALNKDFTGTTWRVDSLGRDNGSLMEYQEWLSPKTLETYRPDAIVISLYENDGVPSFRETRICGVDRCRPGVATTHPAYRNCIAGRTGAFGNAVRVLIRPYFKQVASKLLERSCDLERIAKDEQLPSFDELRGGPGVNPYWDDYVDAVDDLVKQVDGIPLFVYPIRNHAVEDVAPYLLDPFKSKGVTILSNAKTLDFLRQYPSGTTELYANPTDAHAGLPITKRFAMDVAPELAKLLVGSDEDTISLGSPELVTSYLPNSLGIERNAADSYSVTYERGSGEPVMMETVGTRLPAQYTLCALIGKPYVVVYLNPNVNPGERFRITAQDQRAMLEFRVLRYDKNGFKTISAAQPLNAGTDATFEPGASGTGILISDRQEADCSLDRQIDMSSFKVNLTSVR